MIIFQYVMVPYFLSLNMKDPVSWYVVGKRFVKLVSLFKPAKLVAGMFIPMISPRRTTTVMMRRVLMRRRTRIRVSTIICSGCN